MSKENIETMNIYCKIAKIRKMVEALQKNKAGFNYKYVSEDVILAKVTAGLEKYHLDYYPEITPGTTNVTPYFATKIKYPKNGDKIEENINDVIVNADMIFTWVNLDKPSEVLRVPWSVVGQQSDASQALGSGLTYCGRYFLLKFFKSSTTDDDPDNWRQKQQQAMDEDDATVVKEIISQINEVVQKNTTDENRSELQKLLKTYITKDDKPSANYMAITNIDVASAVLSGVTEFFKNTASKASKPKTTKKPEDK